MGEEKESHFRRPELTIVSARTSENELTPREQDRLSILRRNFIVDFFTDYISEHPFDEKDLSLLGVYNDGVIRSFFQRRDYLSTKIEIVKLRELFLETDLRKAVEVVEAEFSELVERVERDQVYYLAQIGGISAAIESYSKSLMLARSAMAENERNRMMYKNNEHQRIKSLLQPVHKSA